MSSAFPDYDEINDIEALSTWVTFLKRAVREGHLVQFWRNRFVTDSRENILELGDDGIWPDYIAMYFRDEKGNKAYCLSVEAYHGQGGTWQMLGAGT